MRALGLDVGDKRIGVALSDPEGMIAVALTVIESRSQDAALQRVIALAGEHEAERIVVGLPLSLDGSMGPQARKVMAFVESLTARTGLPVVTWDERFSTADAERVLVEAGTRRDKRKKHRDAVAAAFVLQSYLDRERGEASGPG